MKTQSLLNLFAETRQMNLKVGLEREELFTCENNTELRNKNTKNTTMCDLAVTTAF